MNTTFTTTNYEAIASSIANQLPESNESFDIEIFFDGCTVYASGFYGVEYEECDCATDRGTQTYYQRIGEHIELTEAVALDNETDEATELDIQAIESLLN